ncbi:AAA family ATPase [Diaminobutyricibacter tongyongensis]|uniref:AAA family ATPase n=1 Tax=Leifsonia tongyongensis TaxID=1268043 RepID=A0A6L9XY26_9MICO|nr:helix-turn-helix transcriptional regulator [Diaminobutyricibacter tongyongensis]NEN06342.1 AAA family ATPase [Diaminobutyricibacter tongyongensis]
MRGWSVTTLPPRWVTPGQPPFVARREEVAELETAWSDVKLGAGRAVFISGAPGIGKSRLVSTACTALHDDGAVVLTGACVQDLGTPFEPFDIPIRDLLALVDVTDGGRDLAQSAHLLEQAFASPVMTEGMEIGQARLFQAVIELLLAATEVRPIILVAEDLHWAAPSALRLLARIVADTVDARLLVIGTFRSTLPDHSDPLADVLANLGRLEGVRRRELAPFTVEEIAQFVTVAGDVSPDVASGSAVVLRALTGGNAFLVRETWRHVIASAESSRLDDTLILELPSTTPDLMRSRISVLTTEQRDVLELAAVMGQEFQLSELIAVSCSSVEVTLSAIDSAVGSGLLEAPQPSREALRFPHAIARQALIEHASRADLMAMNALVAHTLESSFPAAPRLVQRLAHHYTEARALGYGDRAAAYLTRTAEAADDRLAHEDAARSFEHAADLVPDPQARDLLRLRAVHSWILVSDFAQARAGAMRVIDDGDPRSCIRAAIEFEEACWRPGLHGDQAVGLLSSALSRIPAEPDDALYVQGLAALGRATAFTGELDEATRLGDQAIAFARGLGDRQALAEALRLGVSHTLGPRGITARLERSSELSRIAGGPHNEAFGGAAYVSSATCYVAGDRAGLDQAERDLTETARHWGWYWTYFAQCVRFGRSLAAGQLDETESIIGAIQRAEREFRSDTTAGAGALQSFMLRRERGTLASVRSFITGDESPVSRWAPGLLSIYTELDLVEPARRTLSWMLEHDHPAAHQSSDWPACLAFMTEAAVWLRDPGLAAVIHPWLLEYQGLNLMAGYFVAVFGSADCYLGEIESLCQFGAPLDRFTSALEMNERMDAPLHVAYTLAATAACLRSEDPGSERATALADRARSIAEPARMSRVLRLLDKSAPVASAPRRDGLTPREVEVLRLVAEGMSNKAIAAQLVISENTAANHVRSILSKTGSTNRTAAARYAREHALI